MALFSERYGYINPKDNFIKEDVPEEVQNAICNAFSRLRNQINYRQLQRIVWEIFLNKRIDTFNGYKDIILNFILDEYEPWFKKLDLIEFCLKVLKETGIQNNFQPITDFIALLNFHFERLHFCYRIIDNKVTPITDKCEIETIEKALNENTDNVREHLKAALGLLSKRPGADYRNSIKESISAVEAYCREKVDADTLGKALSAIQKENAAFPDVLKSAFVGLYSYTNNPQTGIRHALMDVSGQYTPSAPEATFMLVACSAFINYMRAKGCDDSLKK